MTPQGERELQSQAPLEAEGFRPRTGERGYELEEGQSLDQEASQIALSDLGLSGVKSQMKSLWVAGWGGRGEQPRGGWSSEALEQSLAPCGRWGSGGGIVQKPQSCSWVGWERG